MTDYHFVSTWRLQAPIERVWEEIFHTERWPASANPRLDCLLLVLLALVVGRWRRRT